MPGPRSIVRLDVADLSLPVLLNGITCTRAWLRDEGDGLYSFHATQRLGESREQPGKPASDLLVELVNELGDALDADDVPEWVKGKWDELVKRYEAGSAEG